MKRESTLPDDADMLDEYDFKGGVRGKYAQRYAMGSNIVRLDPDVSEVFHDDSSVNEALRSLIKIARQAAIGTGSSIHGHLDEHGSDR